MRRCYYIIPQAFLHLNGEGTLGKEVLHISAQGIFPPVLHPDHVRAMPQTREVTAHNGGQYYYYNEPLIFWIRSEIFASVVMKKSAIHLDDWTYWAWWWSSGEEGVRQRRILRLR